MVACMFSLRTVFFLEDCSDVECPETENCPDDSYRFPNIFEDFGENRCCSEFQRCQCIPNLACDPPECASGSKLKTITNATGLPGTCCPTFMCTFDETGANTHNNTQNSTIIF